MLSKEDKFIGFFSIALVFSWLGWSFKPMSLKLGTKEWIWFCIVSFIFFILGLYYWINWFVNNKEDKNTMKNIGLGILYIIFIFIVWIPILNLINSNNRRRY